MKIDKLFGIQNQHTDLHYLHYHIDFSKNQIVKKPIQDIMILLNASKVKQAAPL